MIKMVQRTSKFLAFLFVYAMSAYVYMTAKGFILVDGVPVLSNPAYASEEGDIISLDNVDVQLSENMLREDGVSDAPLTIYAFSSMTCSHCGEFHNYILPKIERDYIKNGKIRFVFIHFPLDEKSMQAAKLAYCMPKDKYKEFISVLYHKKDWQFSSNADVLEKYAKQTGLTDEDIKKCWDDKKLTSDILRVRENAIKNIGIKSTPSFILSSAKYKDLIVGTKSYDDIKVSLDKCLDKIDE